MGEHPPDSELLGAYLKGGVESAGAFEELVRRHGGMVHATCRRAAESPEAAEDAAQTVFLVLARQAGSVRGELGAWLHRVAMNAALLARKSEQARRKREKETAEMLAKSRKPAAAEAAPDWVRLAPRLDAAVEKLPSTERAAVVMFYLQGRPRAEVARALGVPDGTVGSRLHSALERLRKLLVRSGGSEFSAAALGVVLAEHAASTSCPPSLLAAAGKLAMAGTGSAGVSASVASLAKGVAKMMFWAKLKLVAAVLGMVAVAGTGGGIAARHLLAGEPAPAASGGLILDESGHWRCFYTWRSPVKREGNALVVTENNAQNKWASQTDLPPAEWFKPEVPDGQWLRWQRQKPRDRMYDYGFLTPYGSPGPALALECLRGRFKIEDPAKVQGMTLSLEYWGGAVVYLNGQEIARGHLSKEGQIEPLALAEDYPREAFLKPDGQPIRSEFGDPKTYRDRVEKRIRKLEPIAIKSENLRKGVNVLAVELHRAPYVGPGLEVESESSQTVWSTCGLVSLELRAAGAEPNIARPKGVQVWNASVMTRSLPSDYANHLEPLDPVVIPAARNGSFTGKLVVSSDSALRGVKAESADLIHRDGKARIPASAVKILYVIRDNRPLCRYASPPGGFWDTLVETPPAEQPLAEKGGAMQPIWVKVKVPPDAVPGEYRGKLTISVSGAAPTEAPVRLTVADWKLPDSRDWTGGHLTFIQSPDTLALFYKVPLWSEEHWKLIEESFKLMGEIGNRYAVIPLLCRTNFGNEQSMVRWVKDGDGYKRDYAVFDRYLDLTQKYMKPDVICLYFWDRYTGERLNARGRPGNLPNNAWGPTLVTRFDPATGRSEDMEAPPHGSPESKAFWAPACKEIRERLEKRGLLDVTMMGTNGDMYMPTQQIADMLAELMPGMKWVSGAHADLRGEKVMKVLPVGYNTAVYVKPTPPPPGLTWDDKRQVGWRLANKADLFPRGGLGHSVPLGNYRLMVEMQNYNNYSGLGRIGFDFWPVGAGGSGQSEGVKRSLTVNGRYPPSWDQLQVDITAENVTSPGANGALPTERFENMREGMQEMEARAFIERAVIAPALRAKLGEELAKKCQQALDDRHWRVSAAIRSRTGFELADTEQSREELYALAAEVAAKLAQ